MSLLAIAAAAMMGTTPAEAPWLYDPDRVDRDAAKHCARLAPDSLSIQVACRRLARKGAAEFAVIAQANYSVPVMREPLERCIQLFTDDGVTDFQMLGVCARKEEEALRELTR